MENAQTVVFDPEQHDLVQLSELHAKGVSILCNRCSSPLIVALSLEEAAKHKVHAGIYCPQNRNHFTMMVELANDFWKRFDSVSDAKQRSTIIVCGDDSIDLSAYKVYINRNIHSTSARFAHLAPPNSIFTRHEAGVYTVVVREYDARKVHRAESNTLEVQVKNDEQITIRVSLQEGRILLARAF